MYLCRVPVVQLSANIISSQSTSNKNTVWKEEDVKSFIQFALNTTANLVGSVNAVPRDNKMPLESLVPLQYQYNNQSSTWHLGDTWGALFSGSEA
jgi:hypothetical protein